MNRFIGALDQGTTSTRFLVFDSAGRIVARAQKEHRQIYPQPGWVEHDPEEILARTRQVMAEVGLKNLTAIGITNQRETTVVWDRQTGRAVTNAIVWQDTRTADLVADFERQRGQDRFREQTGLPLATYFSGLKIRWILDHVPDARMKAEAGDLLFGNIDTFLLWHLTGVHATDVTNASRTQLMNLRTLQWDKDILLAFGIPAVMLPEIRSSSEVYGEHQGIPVAGILGDQQAALVGQTCFAAGEAKNTYGTGCFLLMNTGEAVVPSKCGLLTTVAYKLGAAPACYALEGSIAITGALVQWLRDNLGLIEHSADIETLAETVADNGGVYFVPAFSGLFAPYWKPDARGVIVGLTRFANKGHIARAALEATAFQTREVLDAMEQDSGIRLASLRVDGGMVANELLMQFQSDVVGRPVLRPSVQETTALGAAYAAGLAIGYWQSTAELREQWVVDRTWNPTLAREDSFRQWKKAVTRTFDWV